MGKDETEPPKTVKKESPRVTNQNSKMAPFSHGAQTSTVSEQIANKQKKPWLRCHINSTEFNKF